MKKYSNRAALLHWLTVILISVSIITGFTSSNFSINDKNANIFQIHLFVGMFVLAISLFRTFVLIKDNRPEELNTINSLHLIFKKIVHYSLYLLLIIIPISGLLITNKGEIDLEIIESHPSRFFEKDISGEKFNHEILVYFLLSLIVFHLLGILLHKLRTGENPIKRMIIKD